MEENKAKREVASKDWQWTKQSMHKLMVLRWKNGWNGWLWAQNGSQMTIKVEKLWKWKYLEGKDWNKKIRYQIKNN